MSVADMVGFVAAACTTLSFLPQAAKVYRTRHTRDLSLPMYVILSVGIGMWACYGLMVSSLPIIAANSVSLVLCGYIVYMKLKCG